MLSEVNGSEEQPSGLVRFWRRRLQKAREFDAAMADRAALREGDRVSVSPLALAHRRAIGTLIRPCRAGLYRGWVVQLDGVDGHRGKRAKVTGAMLNRLPAVDDR
jgi:hypothetical protein